MIEPNATLLPDFVLAHKPAGLATHAPDKDREGFVEQLSRRLGERLFVCHRLDKETSGAIVFARNVKAAALLTELFERREVEKEYLLASEGPTTQTSFEVHSRIDRKGSEFVSRETSASEGNAHTLFELLEKKRGVSLWRARPKSGKPHQIRLHSRAAGAPILGDELYGGRPFPALMLHSRRIRFTIDGKAVEHESPPPPLFESPQIGADLLLGQLLHALDRRERLFRFGEHDALRLAHKEARDLRVDRLGRVGWFYRYDPSPLGQDDLRRVDEFSRTAGLEHWHLVSMANRGAAESGHEIASSEGAPSSWTAEEGGLWYQFSSERGRSPGLFLDQRENRAFLRSEANGRSLLNLFCYTGGFSVAAALGGARETVSVDTSKQTLAWAHENFALNGLDLSGHQFIHDDAREYLRRIKRKGRRFDLVVCDPPSFARTKGKIFSLDEEFDELVEAVLEATESGGLALFSTNYEKLSEASFRRRIEKTGEKLRARRIEYRGADLDFELPGEPAIMKSALIWR